MITIALSIRLSRYLMSIQRFSFPDRSLPLKQGNTVSKIVFGKFWGWARYFIYEYVNAGRNGDRFFAGEVEIYDFVTERAKKRIAAKRKKKISRPATSRTLTNTINNFSQNFSHSLPFTHLCYNINKR